jgi:hypothetical protein
MLVRNGNYLQGSWTAAAANNLIGRSNYEFNPDSVSTATPKYVTGRIGRLLDSFTAKVTDVYGNPIVNATINFEIDTLPAGASGTSLTTLSATTDSLGKVSTQLRLGSKRGRYGVIAKVASVPTAIDTFWVDAIGGVTALPVVAGNNQVDSIKTLTSTFTVLTHDDIMAAVPGTEVHFKIDSVPSNAIGQQIIDTMVYTDVKGEASTRIKLGNKAGVYRVKVYSPETDSTTYFTFKATHGIPALAWQRSVPMNADTIGSTLARFTYAITDDDTNAVGNHTIAFAISGKPSSATGDTLLNPVTSTDTITGEASVTLQLGDKVGNYIVSAEDPNVLNSKRFFTGKAKHGKLASVNSFVTSISDTIGTTLPPFGVTLTDRKDNPIDSEMVHYRLADRPDSVLARISADSVMTDSTGKTSIRLTLGDKVGSYTVHASLSAMPSATQQFVLTAMHGAPQKFFAERGLNQTKPILQPLDVPFEIRLTDRASNPISNDTVFFAVTGTPSTASGYSLNRTMAITDANGLASTMLTLGDKVGDYTVKATSLRVGVQSGFIATAINGIARTLAYNLGANQHKQILSLLDTAFVVRITDVGGNPVPGIPVQFAIVDTPTGAWGQRLGHDSVWTSSVDSVRTNSLGCASTYLKFGSKSGIYGIIATSPTLTDTTRFNAIAKVGAPKTLAQYSGNAQVGQLGNLMNPFVVQVSDTGSNLVPGARVVFTIIKPDSARYDSLTTYLGTTDSAGQASTSLTLGDRPGRYTVRASIAGVKDTSFIAFAIMLYADVNNDNYRNIGDLTAIIDHINGRKLLTSFAFNKADMYPIHPDGTVGDGRVNISDLQYCLDSLLVAGWDPTRDWLTTPMSPLLKMEGTALLTGVNAPISTSLTDSCYVQTTYIGSRFFLKNTAPVKGLQAVIYMKNPVVLDKTDIIFPRAKMMTADVKSVGKEVSIILWNSTNTPIEPGDSTIFRLPIQLTDNNVDSIRVLISGDNNVVALLGSKQVDIRNMIPRDWVLYQNYPNPFNPSTTIEFDVPEVTGKIPRVAVQIFNILGQKVTTIERGIHDAGRYSIRWDGNSENGARVASGVYFYRLLAGDYTSTKKMVMIK